MKIAVNVDVLNDLIYEFSSTTSCYDCPFRQECPADCEDDCPEAICELLTK